jgi:hypothetical protein
MNFESKTSENWTRPFNHFTIKLLRKKKNFRVSALKISKALINCERSHFRIFFYLKKSKLSDAEINKKL